MILEFGDKVLLSNRRMFPNDEARYFLGSTVACEGPLLKIEGYSFVRDLTNGHVLRKEEKRTKILSLSSPGYIVYQLPEEVDVEAAEIENIGGEIVLIDGMRHVMNLSERVHCGQI